MAAALAKGLHREGSGQLRTQRPHRISQTYPPLSHTGLLAASVPNPTDPADRAEIRQIQREIADDERRAAACAKELSDQ